MSYEVIARKWRPQSFADVIGQDHVCRTLQNQLAQNRTAHAYLFVGPRGIGKTTIARIFAKALNCQQAPAPEPCCKCQNCIAITEGNSLDVIEIDGASNNSVDNIRQLRDEALYTPISCRFKVYIIDEVHMLSAGAWNALLKTVEEPPPHVKFIFATTEAHKVLPTIISRCQRFDLRRISARQIRQHLRHIADTENVNITNGAIEAIARAADGGMRDGQSLLDQMISFFASDDSQIEEAQVLSIFGLTGTADMHRLVQAMLSNERADVISAVHALAQQGKNLEKLFEEILSFLRGIEICLLVPDPSLILEDGDEAIEQYRQLGQNLGAERLQLLLEIISPASRILHDALNKQVVLETTLLKAMRIAHSVRIEDLLLRLNQIREEGGLAPVEEIPPIQMKTQQVSEKKATAPPASAPVPTQPSPSLQPKSLETPMPSPTPAPTATPTSSSTAPPASAPVPTQPSPSLQPKSLETPMPSPTPAPTATPTSSSTAPPASAPAGKQLHPKNLWHYLIADMENHKENRSILKTYLQEGKPESWQDNTLTVIYDEDFEDLHARNVRQAEPFLNNCLRRISGNKQAKLRVIIKKGVASVDGESPRRGEELPEVREHVEKNEYVQEVLDLFDGKIVQTNG